MSDRNNTDNQNTNTIYIPRGSGVQAPQRPLVRVDRPQQGQYGSQPQQAQPYYGDGQYGNQPRQAQPYYGDGQYGSQPRQAQPYYGDGQYGSQPRQGQTYYGEGQYGSQPQQGQTYYGDGQYGSQPRQAQPYYGEGQYGNQPKRVRKPVKKKKKRRRKSFIGRFIKSLLVILLLIFGMYSCTSLVLINKMDYSATGERSRRSDALTRSYVRNVLLIGTDGRSADEAARSDTMILVTINSRTNEISLISLMRDCYVEIPQYGKNKLNAAYTFGGAELLMDTIEHNFGIAVEDYVSVNFVSFANIVDAVGGIDIEISEAEAGEINNILRNEVNAIMGDNTLDDLLNGGGELHLNGKQALSYARIRYIGNADFERTERQRKVIELVMNKVKSINPTILPKLSASVLPGVETNMTTAELYALSLRVPFIVGYERQQLRVPAEGTYYGQNMDCGDSLIVDFDANYRLICDNVYTSQKNGVS